MKKSLSIIALAALVMLAGCKKNEEQPTGSTKLIAGIEQHKSDSKTSLDGLQINWTADDQLYVYDKDGEAPAYFNLVSGAGTPTGVFEGSYNFTDENVAVYPSSCMYMVDNKSLQINLLATQTASGSGSFGNGANPMLGVFSDMDNLTLTSLCGVLCLQLTGDNVDITAIEIEGGAEDKLCGRFKINDYTNPALNYLENGTNKVTLNFTETVTLTATPQKFYVVLPAGTLANGFTMKVYNGTNEIFSQSTTASLNIPVNTVESMDPLEVVPFNPTTTPLTFEAKTAGSTVRFELKQIDGVEYSTDGNTWQPYTTNTTITLTDVGDKVMFRGSSNTYFGLDGDNDPSPSHFHCTGQCYLYGNVMSLTSPTDFASATTVVEKAFYELFDGDDNYAVYNHPTHDIVLPATTVGNQGYFKMFNYCKSLTRAPELPADNLGSSCYYMMFRGCSSLQTAPVLNATSLAESCYNMMFQSCSSLQTAPALPATSLANSCYYMMFQSCSSLQTAPALPATTLAYTCYSGMFKDCTSLQTAPDLPATTLVLDCYDNMFDGCTSLNSIKCLATTNINGNTDYWVMSVPSGGTFTKASGVTWPTPDYNGIPSGWTVIDQ